MLEKFLWTLNHAQSERLLPVVLGDLFHWPRDNANWLIVRLMEAIGERTLLGVVGNHDTTMHELQQDDTLAILEAAGRIRLVDRTGPWMGEIGGRSILIGGSTWSSGLPKQVSASKSSSSPHAFTVWIAHHDIGFAGYENNGRYRPCEIPGVDLVVNGHIHTPSEGICVGQTTWLNPGNIARVSRGDTHRVRSPRALRVDLSGASWSTAVVDIPHQEYDDVFYPVDAGLCGQEINVSAFVQGLESLRTLRTLSGAGLLEFLRNNLQSDAAEIRDEIMNLAEEVLSNEHT